MSLASPPIFDAVALRGDFPILQQQVNGHPLVYLDNGASTQKPAAVIEAIDAYYRHDNANIHRAVHTLSQRATAGYEEARDKVRAFINAPHRREIIFTRGTTEGINLVAASLGRQILKPGDRILLSELEHHSNIVPWQLIAQQTGAVIDVLPIDDAGELQYDKLDALLSSRTKLVAITHLSNSLGTIVDVERVIAAAHAVGAKVLVDGAQWVGHFATDVQALDCDFYVFSSHKMFGPTGIGVLWGRSELLASMPPYQGGGDMIHTVSFSGSTWADLPNKFEAGTPDIAGAVGLGAAVDYINTNLDFTTSADYEHELLEHATRQMQSIEGVTIVGRAKHKASVLSFTVHGVASHDLGVLLDQRGIAVRTGHHCCMPVMTRLNLPGTVRASFAFYNTRDDVDRLVAAVREITQQLRRGTPAPVVASTPSKKAPADSLQFPAASAPTVQAAADELAETFELLGERDARNEYLIELGQKLPAMPASLKNDVTRVHGCMSVVHLFGREKPESPGTLEFLADSDAFIVRGLIGLLQLLFNGQSAREISGFDISGFFTRLGLEQHITTQRRNGLEAMVNRLRSLAASIESQPE